MIKGYKFLVNEEEKERIISLHQTRTSQQYLNEEVKPNKAQIYSMLKELGFKTANQFMDAYLKKFPSQNTPSNSDNNQGNQGTSQPNPSTNQPEGTPTTEIPKVETGNPSQDTKSNSDNNQGNSQLNPETNQKSGPKDETGKPIGDQKAIASGETPV